MPGRVKSRAVNVPEGHLVECDEEESVRHRILYLEGTPIAHHNQDAPAAQAQCTDRQVCVRCTVDRQGSLVCASGRLPLLELELENWSTDRQ
jgi:hypothetical protein